MIRSLQSKIISKKAVTPNISSLVLSNFNGKIDVGSDAQKASGTADIYSLEQKGFVYKSIDKLATVDEDNPVVGETFYYTLGKLMVVNLV